MADDLQSAESQTPARSSYRVLARTYRPTTFAALVGQDALVRTLSNAFESGRIAHAYMLSGVRGVGKTTTARIIARALNCVGSDGKGGVTVTPCGVCESCVAIAQDRHLDVIEMDAASHTGVDAMRELLDGVRYRPAAARYKVYIIDEVHMLSVQSFNALLKTLEEPPEHVKFVFATTEIRKVPVTVLSRCQRFDLRRVDQATLSEHLGRIAGKEGVTVAPSALSLIARAADGSVRDALSLFDQAIAHAGSEVDEPAVREMLGLADRTSTFDLFEAAMRGDAATALALLRHQHDAGADPLSLIEDLLDLTHWLTRVRITPDVAGQAHVAEAERVRGADLASRLSLPAMMRAWQMLLKGLGEVRIAPSPVQAAEMILIRLAYTARLPTPAEALAGLANSSGPGSSAATAAGTTSAGLSARPMVWATATPPPDARPIAGGAGQPPTAAAPARQPVVDPAPAPVSLPTSFAEVIALAEAAKEGLLHGHLIGSVRLVRFEIGQIDIALEDAAPPDLPHRLSRFLLQQTGRTWMVTLSAEPGAPSVHAQRRAAAAERMRRVKNHPMIAAILAAFPGATVESIKAIDLAAGGKDALANAETDDIDAATGDAVGDVLADDALTDDA